MLDLYRQGGENGGTRGKTCPSATLPTTNPTFTCLASNPVLLCEMLRVLCGCETRLFTLTDKRLLKEFQQKVPG